MKEPAGCRRNLGKLELAVSVKRHVAEHVAANGFKLPEIALAHVTRVESLPRHHGDPFDRLLISQALDQGMAVVTANPIFSKYGAKRIWS